MNQLEVLETAIDDVGYWRWWLADLPRLFQVEFGGVQLWSPPTSDDQPPSGIIALRFFEPKTVAFLEFRTEEFDLPENWPQLLHDDSIEPFGMSHDQAVLASKDEFTQLVSSAQCKEILVGDWPLVATRDEHVFFAFKAGVVGMAIEANRMEVVNHNGVVSFDEVEQAHWQWWDYWKRYWKRKDSKQPLPHDYACEVTIPAGGWDD